MSNFRGLPPRSSSDDPDTFKAGFVTYQGHELYLTWLIPCPRNPDYQKTAERICSEAALKHDHTTIGIRYINPFHSPPASSFENHYSLLIKIDRYRANSPNAEH
jgi:hypothetical protein